MVLNLGPGATSIYNALQAHFGGGCAASIAPQNAAEGVASTPQMGGSSSYEMTSHACIHKLIKYLDRYHLCSKYFEYTVIRKAFLLIQDDKHLTPEGHQKLLKYKKLCSHRGAFLGAANDQGVGRGWVDRPAPPDRPADPHEANQAGSAMLPIR